MLPQASSLQRIHIIANKGTGLQPHTAYILLPVSYFFEVNLLVRQEIAHAESAENTPAENAASEPVELAGRAPWALRRVGSCKVK